MCSKWAERLPSAVTTVQPSARALVSGPPALTIGSIARVMPGLRASRRPAGRREALSPGMTLAIEPMVNAGGPETKALADGWTVVTADGSLSAHFEHTVAITAEGREVLTARVPAHA